MATTEKLKPPTGLLDGVKGYETKFMKCRLRRYCIREERFEIYGEQVAPGQHCKLGHGWRFYYNDGTTEVVTIWERK